MENMWLATDEVGLGGVWWGIAPLEDRMEKVEKIIGIPESQRAFGIFALGYPAEERTQQNRYEKPGSIVCQEGKTGTKCTQILPKET